MLLFGDLHLCLRKPWSEEFPLLEGFQLRPSTLLIPYTSKLAHGSTKTENRAGPGADCGNV